MFSFNELIEIKITMESKLEQFDKYYTDKERAVIISILEKVKAEIDKYGKPN